MHPNSFLENPHFPGPLGGETALEAIETLVHCLARDLGWSDALRTSTLDAVMAREAQTPTGFGGGLAVPHGFVADLRESVCAIGTSQDGIDFGAPDGSLAHVMVLIVHPDLPESRAAHLGTLAELARRFQDAGRVQRLLAAQDADAARVAFNSES